MREKKIEEMAKVIANKKTLSIIEATGIAEILTAEDYCKQSEGEWEKRDFIIFDFVKTAYRCTYCNTTWDAPTKFCPHCGAKMKGE